MTHRFFRRTFITFCYEQDDGKEIVETLFQRYSCGAGHFQQGGSAHFNIHRQYLDESSVRYARRLINGEPCGVRFAFNETSREYVDEKRVNDEGKSVFSLCSRNTPN